MTNDQDSRLMDAFRKLRDAEAAPDEEALYAFYDALPTMAAGDMLGEWRGGILSRGHPVERQLAVMRWAGKRFAGPDEVYPIISLDGEGKRVVNDALGAATLREVAFRGVVTATMIYDSAPVFDHFRRVGNDLVVGAMDRKGDDGPMLFFYLERLADR